MSAGHPMTEQHVEKVAQAICAAKNGPNGWRLRSDETRGLYRRMAEAAIAALQLTEERVSDG